MATKTIRLACLSAARAGGKVSAGHLRAAIASLAARASDGEE